MNTDVLCEYICTWITIFRNVAKRAVHRAVRLDGRLHKGQRLAEQGLSCNYRRQYRIYSSTEIGLKNLKNELKKKKTDATDYKKKNDVYEHLKKNHALDYEKPNDLQHYSFRENRKHKT
eukprot:5414862-Amphidinium_carterae.1